MPLGVLKSQSINFIPKLPKAKVEAIDRLGFCKSEILLLKFNKVFWNP